MDLLLCFSGGFVIIKTLYWRLFSSSQIPLERLSDTQIIQSTMNTQSRLEGPVDGLSISREEDLLNFVQSSLTIYTIISTSR